jgi:hypothetical protein
MCGKSGCACDSRPWVDKSNAFAALLNDLTKVDHRAHLMKVARCLFLTISVFGRQFVKEHVKHLDVLVVDEAAQASEPELLIPM